MPENSTPPHMRDRKDIAEFVYRDMKESQRATFDVAAAYGRWLLGSLFLIHGGALFGLFSFLDNFAAEPAALSKYVAAVCWFVVGLLLALTSGFLAWMNWAFNSDNYDGWADPNMLWDPNTWVGPTRHTWGVNLTYWAAIVIGFVSAIAVLGGTHSLLTGKWFPILVD